MATDYSALLTKLRKSMETAVHNQEYHRLIGLDVAVRQCVEEAMSECENNQNLKAKMAGQLQEILSVYKLVTQTCSEKSQDLKKEMQRLKHSKKGASQYLQVAGKYSR